MAKGRPVQNDYKKIKQMHDAGKSYRQIAEELLISESGVGFALRKLREQKRLEE